MMTENKNDGKENEETKVELCENKDQIFIESIIEDSIEDSRTMKEKAFQEITFEINQLKREIKNTELYKRKARPIIDFENNYISTMQTPLFYIPVPYNRTKIEEINEEDKNYELIEKICKYIHSCKNLPLLHILKFTKKLVLQEEWLTAFKETENIKTIKFIQKFRKYKRNLKETEETEEIFKKKKQEIFTKRISNEIFNFFKNSKNLENFNLKIFFNQNIYFPVKLSLKENIKKKKQEIDKNFFGVVFEYMQTKKSKMKIEIANIKRSINNHTHSSHITTLNRILPDLARCSNPLDIIEFLKMINQKSNIPYYNYYQRGDPHIMVTNSNYYGENVTFNVRGRDIYKKK